jgi:hypothetical protein
MIKNLKYLMMRILAGLVLLFAVNAVVAQDSIVLKIDSLKTTTVSVNRDLAGFDKIKLETGDSLIVTIIAETQTEVAFKYPLNTMINKMLYTKIKEINYQDGKIRAFRNMAPVTGVGAEPDNLWRIVVLTEDENEVSGMKEIGPITSKAEGRTLKTSIELLEKNARVNLQKRAVRMNATKILIKKKNIDQAYGEIPVVEFEGVAYGVE